MEIRRPFCLAEKPKRSVVWIIIAEKMKAWPVLYKSNEKPGIMAIGRVRNDRRGEQIFSISFLNDPEF